MRSGKAKRIEIGELYEKHAGRQAELEAEYRADLDTRLEKARQKAFKPPRVGDDAALDTMSFRDALMYVADQRETSALSSNPGEAVVTHGVVVTSTQESPE